MPSSGIQEQHAMIIRSAARRIGFSFCGFSRAEFLEDEAPRLEKWLNEKRHGNMAYMDNHFDKRLDPRKLVPGAKTVISLLYNYFPGKNEEEETGLRISSYAAGEDYHHVVRLKLKELMAVIRDEIGEVSGRVFVDSAPVLDKAWAKRSGLGWIGKNSNLINKEQGSFFFIAEIILDLELPPDQEIKDYCGTCTACIEACPTDAIIEPYVVDGSKCISYFTIELRDAIPHDVKGKFADWIFGCDICQDVCPWNRFAQKHNEPLFESNPKKQPSTEEWLEMTEDIFKEIYGRSALTRTGLEGIKRNIRFVLDE